MVGIEREFLVCYCMMKDMEGWKLQMVKLSFLKLMKCCCGGCRSYLKCTRCVYSTCCRNMIIKHADAFHPQGRNKKTSYKLSAPIVLPKPLFCICGFSSTSGNHLGEWVLKCNDAKSVLCLLQSLPSLYKLAILKWDQSNFGTLCFSHDYVLVTYTPLHAIYNGYQYFVLYPSWLLYFPSSQLLSVPLSLLSFVFSDFQMFHMNVSFSLSHFHNTWSIILTLPPTEIFIPCLARHLVRCEGGRKSAYPSMSAAMVYRGDVTGGMLNLVGSLGLENIGLASILPDVPMNNSSIDMSHFMSVSMDVDDSWMHFSNTSMFTCKSLW